MSWWSHGPPYHEDIPENEVGAEWWAAAESVDPRNSKADTINVSVNRVMREPYQPDMLITA